MAQIHVGDTHTHLFLCATITAAPADDLFRLLFGITLLFLASAVMQRLYTLASTPGATQRYQMRAPAGHGVAILAALAGAGGRGLVPAVACLCTYLTLRATKVGYPAGRQAIMQPPSRRR